MDEKINKCVSECSIARGLCEMNHFFGQGALFTGRSTKPRTRNRAGNNKSRRERALLVSTKAEREENGIRRRGPVKLSLVPPTCLLPRVFTGARALARRWLAFFLHASERRTCGYIIHHAIVRLERRPMS